MPAGAYKRVLQVWLLANLAGVTILLISCGAGGGGTTPAPEPKTPTTITLSTSSLNFGNQPVAITSAPAAVTLKNTGKSTLKISALAMSGSDAASFAQTSTCEGLIASGQSCKIAILFTPKASGARQATLTITDNDAASPHAISLSGKGLHDVVLTWTPSASSGIAGYLILRSNGALPSAKAILPTPVAATTYTDTSVQPGQKYQYWVTAVSVIGLLQSHISPGVSVTIPSP